MAITVQMQFESAVTEIYQDAFVGSSIENGATIITFDLRQRDFQPELGATSTLSWRKEAYHVDIHELSTFHNPVSGHCHCATAIRGQSVSGSAITTCRRFDCVFGDGVRISKYFPRCCGEKSPARGSGFRVRLRTLGFLRNAAYPRFCP
jgi:hypothetical protein